MERWKGSGVAFGLTTPADVAGHGPFQEQRGLPAICSVLFGQNRHSTIRYQPHVPGRQIHDRRYVQRRIALVSHAISKSRKNVVHIFYFH